MSPHNPSTHRKQTLPTFQIALLFLLLVLCGVGIVSSTAQSTQEDERKFENTVPAHVPLKVKIKNEQALKNANNKRWARDLEIEVTNTGDKPIYFLFMLVVMPDVTSGGYPHALQITYGRKELVRLDTPIQADDIPIKSGETTTLNVSVDQVSTYEKSRDKEKRAEAKKVRIDMQLINFGDGTGLRGTDGHPTPQRGRKDLSNIPRLRKTDNSPPNVRGRETNSSADLWKGTYSQLPANFLRVNFSPPNANSDSCSNAFVQDICGCQSNGDCFYGVPDFATCPCDDPHQFLAFVHTTCRHPFGGCSLTSTVTRDCETQFNGIQHCQYQEEGPSCAVGDPTPTPTPDETPTPTPTVTPTPEPVCAEDCTLRNPQAYCGYPIGPGPSTAYCHLPDEFCSYGPSADFVAHPTGCPDAAYLDPDRTYCCRCAEQSCPAGMSVSLSSCACVPTVGGGGGDTPPVDGGGGGGGGCYFYSEYFYSDGELMNGNSCTDTYLVEGFVCNGVFNGGARLVTNGCGSAR